VYLCIYLYIYLIVYISHSHIHVFLYQLCFSTAQHYVPQSATLQFPSPERLTLFLSNFDYYLGKFSFSLHACYTICARVCVCVHACMYVYEN